MNCRPIKGNCVDLELLKKLHLETIADIQDQCDFAQSAVFTAKARRQFVHDKIHALKYGIRAMNREYRFGAMRQMRRLLADAHYEMAQVESTLAQAKTRYSNCRTLIFMMKSAVSLMEKAGE